MAESKLRMQVREFHQAFGVPVLDRPQVPSDDRVRLRLRLVAEEFCELLESCLHPDDERANDCMDEIRDWIRNAISCDMSVNLKEAADALADIQYVLHGTALEMGVDMGPIEDAVHASNMAKAGGPIVNGKITKPQGWKPPDIAGLLKKQGWEG